MGKSSKNEVPETAEEGELKRTAIERWNDHQARLLPFENKYIEDVARNPAAAQARAAGQANADLAQKVSTVPALGAPGISPTSGRATAPALNIGGTFANAQVNTAQNVLDNRAKGLQSVVDMGQGKAALSMKGYETAASSAVDRAITDTRTAQENRAAIGGAIMSGIGAGAAIGKKAYWDWQKEKGMEEIGKAAAMRDSPALMWENYQPKPMAAPWASSAAFDGTVKNRGY